MSTILIIVVVLLLLGGGGFGYSRYRGNYTSGPGVAGGGFGSNPIMLILIILVVLALFGGVFVGPRMGWY
jgi:uncharacterized membrane protein